MTQPLFHLRRDALRRLLGKTGHFQHFLLVPLKKMTKRCKTSRIPRTDTTSFFVIAADAPRQARGRDTATFSSKKRRAPASTRQNGPFCAFPYSHRHVCVSTWGVLRGEPVLPRGLGLLQYLTDSFRRFAHVLKVEGFAPVHVHTGR